MSLDSIRLLLVEDDIGDADLLCELLELVPAISFQVTHSRRLQEALEYLQGESFDALLLDLSLPDSHGLTTVSRIYAQAPNLPIVILSGLEDESLATIAVQQGAQDYLVKGQVNSELLAKAIRYAIERAKNLQLLSQREEELQRANQELERRVEERVRELRQLEAQLRQALAQEQKLNELKSRIITTVSHEYRTPLAAIFSSTELLEAYQHKWDEQKQLKHLQRIKASVRYLTALVEEVLFLNKSESTVLDFVPTLIDVESLVSRIVQEKQAEIDGKHALELIIQNQVGQIFADEQLLQRILEHLLSNAIQYSPGGGKIKVKLASDDQEVILQVCDRGIGIPIDEQEDVFDSFSRASNVGVIRGTGLGLSIVKKCVDLHQGKIAITSQVGVGTTATVHLPR